MLVPRRFPPDRDVEEFVRAGLAHRALRAPVPTFEHVRVVDVRFPSGGRAIARQMPPVPAREISQVRRVLNDDMDELGWESMYFAHTEARSGRLVECYQIIYPVGRRPPLEMVPIGHFVAQGRTVVVTFPPPPVARQVQASCTVEGFYPSSCKL